jgi:hypothetical protein
MAFSAEQLSRFNADYTAVTGKPVQLFVCPITLKDELGAALCDGHILNSSIKTASRKTVVQRVDVDNYFGRTIEPDLVSFLNVPVSTAQELINKGRRSLTVTLPSGEKTEAFFADAKARVKFPQIDLLDTSGVTIASPFLRTGQLEPKLHKGLQVEWLMAFTNSALLGAMLKSAHMALFRMMGYRYVLGASGDCLRLALADFYNDRADKAQSIAYFSKFNGAVKPALNDIPDDVCNTLDDGALWFHYQKGGLEKNLLFALSCLFQVNSHLITVMVPHCLDEGCFGAAYAHYEAALKDWTTPQDIHFGCLVDEKVLVHPQPLSVRHAPRPAAE